MNEEAKILSITENIKEDNLLSASRRSLSFYSTPTRTISSALLGSLSSPTMLSVAEEFVNEFLSYHALVSRNFTRRSAIQWSDVPVK